MEKALDDYSLIHERLRKLIVPLIQKVLKERPLHYIEFCANYFQRLLKESEMSSDSTEQILRNEDPQEKPPLQGSASLSALPDCKGLSLRGTSSWNHPGETKNSQPTWQNIVYTKADFSRKMGDQPDIIQEHEEAMIVDKNGEKKSDFEEKELFNPKNITSENDFYSESRPLLDEEIDSYLCELINRASTSCSSAIPVPPNGRKDTCTTEREKESDDSSSSSDSDDSCYYLLHDDQKEESENLISDHVFSVSCYNDLNRSDPEDFTLERNLCDCEGSNERFNLEKINSIINTFSRRFRNSISYLSDAEFCFTECLRKELKTIAENQSVGETHETVMTDSSEIVRSPTDDNKKMLYVYKDCTETISESSRYMNSMPMYQRKQTSECKKSCGRNCSYRKEEFKQKNTSDYDAIEECKDLREENTHNSKFKGRIRKDNIDIDSETKKDMLNGKCVINVNSNPFSSKTDINKSGICSEDNNNFHRLCANTDKTVEKDLKQVNADCQKYTSRHNQMLESRLTSFYPGNKSFYRGSLIPFQYVRPNIINPYSDSSRVVPTNLGQKIGEQGDVLPHLRRHCFVGAEYRQTSLGSESHLTTEGHGNDMISHFNNDILTNNEEKSETFPVVTEESKLAELENTRENSVQYANLENTKENINDTEEIIVSTNKASDPNNLKCICSSDSNSFNSSENIIEKNKILDNIKIQNYDYLNVDMNICCENQSNCVDSPDSNNLKNSKSIEDENQALKPLSREFTIKEHDYQIRVEEEPEAENSSRETKSLHNINAGDTFLKNEIISSTIGKQNLEPGLAGGDFLQTSSEERREDDTNISLNSPEISLALVETAVREALEAQVEDGEDLYLTDNDLSVCSSDEPYSSEDDDSFDQL